MKTRKMLSVWTLLALLAASSCADRAPSPRRPEPQKSKVAPASGQAEVLQDGDSSGLVDLERAKKLLANRKFEDLLDTFEPDTVARLSPGERTVLANVFHEAASQLRFKFKNVSYSSLICERGLMLIPEHQGLLRLQIRNYLHADMLLYGGAEELSGTLLAVDPNSVENQLLRGKIAFEQGEYDEAVVWLNKAARVGRRQRGKLIEEAWHLLDLAKGKQKEIKAALSMTRELETRLLRARKRSRKSATRKLKAESQDRVTQGGSITLYMTQWCRYCTKTRSLLKSMQVVFTEKNIEKNRDALMEMMRYAEEAGIKVTGVPVVRIGSSMVVGYNPQRIKKLVDQIR